MKTKDLSKPQAEFNLVWDCVGVVIAIFCLLVLFLAYPTLTHAAERDDSARWRASFGLVDGQVSDDARERLYAPTFKRPLTAGSVGTTLSQPQQPNTAGIHGAATQLRIGF